MQKIKGSYKVLRYTNVWAFFVFETFGGFYNVQETNL